MARGRRAAAKAAAESMKNLPPPLSDQEDMPDVSSMSTPKDMSEVEDEPAGAGEGEEEEHDGNTTTVEKDDDANAPGENDKEGERASQVPSTVQVA
ncbi:hypothetical protein KEM55_004391 [Ascosphaera atra]|nr:hypothetical protein KEM55_004391 [Ascosphaera atra]